MAGVRKRLGSLLGPVGRAAKIAAVTAESVGATTPPSVTVSGSDLNRTFHFKLQQGLPGVNAVENDAASAAYILSGMSETRAALDATFLQRPDRRRAVAYGDSITQNFGYGPYVIARLGLNDYISRGVAGRPMADGTANGAGGVTTVTQNTDHGLFGLVTIAHGTNDFKLNVPLGALGAVSDTVFDRTTFYGAFRHAIGHILKNSPLTRIVLCTPLKRNNDGYTDESTNTAGHQLRDYAQAIREVGEMYGLPVCDWYSNSGFNAWTLGVLTYDGLHPSVIGHERLGLFMGDFIASIIGGTDYEEPVDTTPPSAVSNLVITGQTATTVSLAWDAATDDVGIAGYEWSLNGDYYTPKPGYWGDTTLTIKDLATDAFTVYIRAYDAAGNRGPVVLVHSDAVVTDSFTAANGSFLSGRSTDTGGLAWVTLSGSATSAEIVGNAVRRRSGGNGFGWSTIDPAITDGILEVVLGAANPTGSQALGQIVFRVQDKDNYWALNVRNLSAQPFYAITKRVAGGPSAEGMLATSVVPAAGDRVRIVLSGDDATLFVNGANRGTCHMGGAFAAQSRVGLGVHSSDGVTTFDELTFTPA